MFKTNDMHEGQSQTTSQNKLSLPESILRELQKQKQELLLIKEQQQTIFSIDETLRKKNTEIVRLRTLVEKYQPFYKKYQDLSYDYSQKCAKINQKDKEVTMLLKQVDELIKQHDIIESKLIESDRQRTQLIKEQREIEVRYFLHKKVNTQIQHTFKLYQQECKKKEMGLLRDLEKAYKQVTCNQAIISELNKRIDDYEMKVFENEELRKKLSQKTSKETKYLEEAQKKPKSIVANDPLEYEHSSKHVEMIRKENQTLKHVLSIKEEELVKYKILNHEISIEFDKSVGRICDFEKQLTKYRQENHELQKVLNLFVEKQKYEQMHVRQLQRLKMKPDPSINQESQAQENPRQNQFHANQYSESEDLNA